MVAKKHTGVSSVWYVIIDAALQVMEGYDYMADLAYGANFSVYRIFDIGSTWSSGRVTFYTRIDDGEGYEDNGHGEVQCFNMVDIIGIGLINVQTCMGIRVDRKCIRIDYLTLDEGILPLLFECDEDMYKRIARIINTYKRRIKCNEEVCL
jgi:hypothetical protein